MAGLTFVAMRTQISNIGQLVQVDTEVIGRQTIKGKDMQQLPCLENAWLLIENGLISDFGSMSDLPEQQV
ncbi:MAG: hypothetical protein RIQ62_1469, partial [Bacteroidota bacterium]